MVSGCPTLAGTTPSANLVQDVAFIINGYSSSVMTGASGVIISKAPTPCVSYSCTVSSINCWTSESGR